MNIVGKKVTHTKYGAGKIVALEENKVTVEFEAGTKGFQFPESFQQHFEIGDKQARKYIDTLLDKANEEKAEIRMQKVKEEHTRARIQKIKIKPNSQAVFSLDEKEAEDVANQWSVFTGTYISGKTKGEPRVPKNLNMNSACLLTIKPEGEPEEKRVILGIFMTPEEFIGEECKAGVINAHEKYRIFWEHSENPLLFWDYFAGESQLIKWGNSKMKYISHTTIQSILEDMIKLTDDEEKQEEIQEFHRYFSQMNQY